MDCSILPLGIHGNTEFMQPHCWMEKQETLEALTTLTAVSTVPLYSSALSVLWNDSKRAIHHVPKTSCREGNDEAKKKPRDTQVESPIEWPSHLQCAVASPPLLTAFRYFSHLSYLKSTIYLGLFVLMLGGGQFYFPTNFSLLFSVLCCLCSPVKLTVVLAPAPSFSVKCAFNHLVLTVSLFRRRIDVSPRAFMKHSQLFEAMKSSEDGTYKVTEHFAVWSMLERQTTANQCASQMPLDCTPLKPVAFLEGRCTESERRECKIRHFDLVVCYISPSHMVRLWAQAWPRLMKRISS